MNVVVIDGQGGHLGAGLVKEILEKFPKIRLTAIGINAIATSAMLKAGAPRGATGENSVSVCCRSADVIIGPVGIVIADSMLGEVTPKIALSVARSSAVRILIPMNKCENLVAGVGNMNMAALIGDAVSKLEALFSAVED